MTDAEWVLVGCSFGIGMYFAGFWAGSKLTRALREVEIHEVPQIVTTEHIVEVEKPVVVQIPAATVQRTTGPSLPVMGINNRNVVTNPAERAQMERMQDLMGLSPEA